MLKRFIYPEKAITQIIKTYVSYCHLNLQHSAHLHYKSFTKFVLRKANISLYIECRILYFKIIDVYCHAWQWKTNDNRPKYKRFVRKINFIESHECGNFEIDPSGTTKEEERKEDFSSEVAHFTTVTSRPTAEAL